jgi:hypothetical protein
MARGVVTYCGFQVLFIILALRLAAGKIKQAATAVQLTRRQWQGARGNRVIRDQLVL